jgi:hypothetical protein
MGKWVAGIVGPILVAVISAVLIAHFTKPTPSPTTPPPPITVEGRVINDSSSGLIPGAKISIQGPGLSGEDMSDSEGRYLFQFPKATPTVVHLDIQASGFQDFRRTISLQGDDNEEIRLKPSAPPPPPPPGNPTATFVPPPPATRYIRRPTGVWVGPPPGKRP